jgi:nitrogen regulatory protein PII 1
MTYVLVKAVVRPEKSAPVLQALLEAGYPAVTKVDVFGRGKQQGLKIGNVVYDELPKEMLLVVVPETEKEAVVRTIANSARTGTEGSHGDGKIFISPVEEVYTVSTGVKEEVALPEPALTAV